MLVTSVNLCLQRALILDPLCRLYFWGYIVTSLIFVGAIFFTLCAHVFFSLIWLKQKKTHNFVFDDSFNGTLKLENIIEFNFWVSQGVCFFHQLQNGVIIDVNLQTSIQVSHFFSPLFCSMLSPKSNSSSAINLTLFIYSSF